MSAGPRNDKMHTYNWIAVWKQTRSWPCLSYGTTFPLFLASKIINIFSSAFLTNAKQDDWSRCKTGCANVFFFHFAENQIKGRQRKPSPKPGQPPSQPPRARYYLPCFQQTALELSKRRLESAPFSLYFYGLDNSAAATVSFLSLSLPQERMDVK